MRTRSLLAALARRDDTRARRRSGRASRAPPSDVRGAFFANWDRYARDYFVKQIPADKLNVIDYAFAFSTPTGCALSDVWSDFQAPTWERREQRRRRRRRSVEPGQHLFGNFNQLAKLKAAHPNLRLEMSIGGWTGSTYFSDAAATPASRAAFVSSCIDLIIKGNLPTGGWPPIRPAASARQRASSTASTSTGSTRAPIPATARTTRPPTSTTRRCCCRSSGTSSTCRAR